MTDVIAAAPLAHCRFCHDLSQLTNTLMSKVSQEELSASKLGDIVLDLNEKKMLLKRKKDENFDIKESIVLSDEVRRYLNVLQIEKFQHCRLCYNKDDSQRCDFHRRYIFCKDPLTSYDEYMEFLNSEMGIISFVELYYSYLSVEFWRPTAKFLFRDLTGFDGVKDLLREYKYAADENVDRIDVQTMDMD
ncbi:hypothetical protein [Ectropis obliqua nucleopolyhedrovirus]|uniref:Putative 24.0 kDa protein n=1 Tax=Ectropis obliqua nucleopolyhedrovirus TaxID=59376 RepID=A0EYS3_9ABAC|nr:hypothetical protein EONV_gp020 [Ectropis obliqua nucleopolyhedrovirus]ABI35704.1 hypothetical protein [Ectropis obliqua nucleopolyhedrovirus]AGS47884.1 putative 24.0 kDa protein [Ectropis obliqua nucleopolyhedrovirus]QWV59606.1 hypothetical protein EONV_gp020 [Ectropis obliqua nucleopolyhedrovirus]UYO72812.1 hypothetical protein EONV-gp020 [Ectropis obliqua nucleopolyhedrovirus]